MKKLTSLIAVLFVILSVQANNTPYLGVCNEILLPPSVNDYLNILSIKADIEANRNDYVMTGSFTVIKNPKNNSDIAHTVDISFRNNQVLSRRAPIYMKVVKPAMDELKKAYNDKFDEYIASMESDLEMVRSCYTGINDDVMIRGGYEAQMFAVLNALKDSKIQK